MVTWLLKSFVPPDRQKQSVSPDSNPSKKGRAAEQDVGVAVRVGVGVGVGVGVQVPTHVSVGVAVGGGPSTQMV